jgi:hypothetical protein
MPTIERDASRELTLSTCSGPKHRHPDSWPTPPVAGSDESRSGLQRIDGVP